MGWAFPWASSLGSEFNFDFNVSFTEEQQREGVVEYNYKRGGRNDRATGKLRFPVKDGDCKIRHYWHIRRLQGRCTSCRAPGCRGI